MKYIEVLICAALISFMAGLYYETEYKQFPPKVEAPKTKRPASTQEQKDAVAEVFNDKDPNLAKTNDIVEDDDSKLESCSKTNTMPCNDHPVDPVKEELNEHPQKDGLFRKGEKVTCVYDGIYSWTDGNEFVKGVAMQCDVIQVTEELPEFGLHYQHIKVNCLRGLKTMWSDQPGVGMVKGHKLNLVERWYSSDECYHFQQG